MPSNPMQKKSQNAFIFGMLTTIAVVLIIGVILYLIVIQPMLKKQKASQTYITTAFRLKPGVDVKSGDELTSGMIEAVEIPITTETTTTDFVQQKIDVDGYKSKIDLTGGTILTHSMLYSEETPDSLRYVEYNMIIMPTLLDVGNYVDIRLKLPNAQDLIVIPKKQIVNLYNDTIGLNLTEEEILILNSAIVEAYIMPSSEIYTTLYVEAGTQKTAQTTYFPTGEVLNLIKMDNNIVEEARNALNERYNQTLDIDGKTYNENALTRGYIENAEAPYIESKDSNIKTGVQQQIQKAKEARKNYLSGLNGY